MCIRDRHRVAEHLLQLAALPDAALGDHRHRKLVRDAVEQRVVRDCRAARLFRVAAERRADEVEAERRRVRAVLKAGAVRHEELIGIFLAHRLEEAVQRAAVRARAVRRVERDDLHPDLRQRVHLRHRRRDIDVAVFVNALDDADHRQVALLADVENIRHRIRADADGAALPGRKRHFAHKVIAVKRLIRQRLTGCLLYTSRGSGGDRAGREEARPDRPVR